MYATSYYQRLDTGSGRGILVAAGGEDRLDEVRISTMVSAGFAHARPASARALETLPEHLQDEVCQCAVVDRYYKRENSNIDVCSKCHRPPALVATYALLNECENCGKQYLSLTLPDKMLLCPSCTEAYGG